MSALPILLICYLDCPSLFLDLRSHHSRALTIEALLLCFSGLLSFLLSFPLAFSGLSLEAFCWMGKSDSMFSRMNDNPKITSADTSCWPPLADGFFRVLTFFTFFLLVLLFGEVIFVHLAACTMVSRELPSGGLWASCLVGQRLLGRGRPRLQCG